MCLGRLIEVSKHILGKGGAAPPDVKFVIESDLLFGQSDVGGVTPTE
jgi:hypothetical protein